jgi:hypothetical protein
VVQAGKTVKARAVACGGVGFPVPVFAMVTCALGITAPLVSVALPVSCALSCALIIGTQIITAVIAIEMRRTFVAFTHSFQETVIPLRFNLGRTGIILYTF